MLNAKLCIDDIRKLERAYRDLDKFIEIVNETNKKFDKPMNVSSFITDAHKCLSEVLYGY